MGKRESDDTEEDRIAELEFCVIQPFSDSIFDLTTNKFGRAC